MNYGVDFEFTVQSAPYKEFRASASLPNQPYKSPVTTAKKHRLQRNRSAEAHRPRISGEDFLDDSPVSHGREVLPRMDRVLNERKQDPQGRCEGFQSSGFKVQSCMLNF